MRPSVKVDGNRRIPHKANIDRNKNRSTLSVLDIRLFRIRGRSALRFIETFDLCLRISQAEIRSEELFCLCKHDLMTCTPHSCRQTCFGGWPPSLATCNHKQRIRRQDRLQRLSRVTAQTKQDTCFQAANLFQLIPLFGGSARTSDFGRDVHRHEQRDDTPHRYR
jgi:hypothetical protein